MVRNYCPKDPPKYERADLPKLADEFRKSKTSMRDFAKSKGIPFTTVQRWIKNIPKKQNRGRSRVLTDDEEKLIVTALLFLGDSNMPLDRDDIRTIVKEFIKERA